MKFLTLIPCSLVAIFSAFAQIPDTTKVDVWGHAPSASDDRFSNPKSKLYAGPDGWFNSGEVRATVSNAARTAYKHTVSFKLVSGNYVAVKDLLVLNMEFGTAARPKTGVYTVGPKGNAAQNTVHLSFGDVGDNQIKEWSAQAGAGTLTISSVNGFTYFTCRNVLLQPTGMSNKGEMKNPMTLGFEGAIAPE